ncbi:MAG: hypothetical protein JNL16_13695 [Dechloromonas sp.]|nr:hypothetical protein [Dechloromonas sp.]
MRYWLAPLAVVLLLASCATPPPESEQQPAEPAASKPPSSRPARQPGLSAEAQRALARRGIKQHDTSPVSVTSRCSHVDEIGTATKLNLQVDDGDVRDFQANVAIKGRGACRFALPDFRQETATPQVLLRHARDSKCTVRMWREQGEKITIAFTGCHKSCEGKAFDYLWPILVESKTGQCS